jgi:hypothetical protein
MTDLEIHVTGETTAVPECQADLRCESWELGCRHAARLPCCCASGRARANSSDTREEVIAAMNQLCTPSCAPKCEGAHCVVHVDQGRWRAASAQSGVRAAVSRCNGITLAGQGGTTDSSFLNGIERVLTLHMQAMRA